VTPAPERVRYRERLLPAWWLWLVVAGAAVSMGAAYGGPFHATVGWSTGVATAILMTAGLLAWSPVIRVGEGYLVAGRARIEIEFVSDVDELDRAHAATTRGRDADARAWMLIRGWIPTALRVNISDPADPTPYWFLSTRHPHRLAAAILEERTEHERSMRDSGRLPS
jgi:hypothetical protein